MTEKKESDRRNKKIMTSLLTFHALILPKPSAKKRKNEKKYNKEKSTSYPCLCFSLLKIDITYMSGNTSRILTNPFAVFSALKCYAHTTHHNFISKLKIYRRKEANSLFVITSLPLCHLVFSVITRKLGWNSIL